MHVIDIKNLLRNWSNNKQRINNNRTTTLDGQLSKSLGEGLGVELSLLSKALHNNLLDTPREGFLTYAMYHHRETIKLITLL